MIYSCTPSAHRAKIMELITVTLKNNPNGVEPKEHMMMFVFCLGIRYAGYHHG